MIVVDTNVLAYLLIPGKETSNAEKVLKKDPIWIAPRLWRSELRSVLLKYLRNSFLELSNALEIIAKAEQLMKGREYEVNSVRVLELSTNSTCSAYDCEFVALAMETGAKLVTTDKKIITQFPKSVLSIQQFLSTSTV